MKQEQTTFRPSTDGLLDKLRKESATQKPVMSLNKYIELLLLTHPDRQTTKPTK